MDLSIGPEGDAFRSVIRGWLADNLPADLNEDDGDADALFERRRDWNATLFESGWAAIDWPTEYGGRGASVLEQLIYIEEMARAGAPGPVNAIGVANIAPAIMTIGTQEQKERFLKPMLRGEEIWSQGMSEPDAGSDLAALSCRAVRDGDRFIVNGQKTWNSLGHRADWCQLYVRTDPAAPKHEGMTCLLVDMRSAGVDARPIRTMGGSLDFADVFFTDVEVPVEAVLGEVGSGWHVATRTLGFERAGVAKLALMLQENVDRLLADAGADRREDPIVRQLLAARHTDAVLLRLLSQRTISAVMNGRTPGAEASVVKLAWSQMEQRVAESAMDVLGLDALSGAWGERLAGSRSLTIAGGTTEVNKNIVGERVLGLPREPKV
ncbi:MAG: acyl-CoA dehydrogenase family protein [Acidimicrobiales bacterium]|nr:acyl-CoA dehydrogenase family protein [Acidimicrobiales bacterium]